MAVVKSFLIIPRSGCRPCGRHLQGTTGFSRGTPLDTTKKCRHCHGNRPVRRSHTRAEVPKRCRQARTRVRCQKYDLCGVSEKVISVRINEIITHFRGVYKI